LLDLFRNKAFLLFCISEFLISFATGIDLAIYGFWLFNLTESVFIVSLSTTIIMAGPFLFRRIVGKIVDNWNPFVVLSLSLFLFIIGSLVPLFVSDKSGVPWIILSLFGIGFAYAASNNVWPTLSTKILKAEQLAKANGVLSLIENFRLFVGTAVGGALYGLIGPHDVFFTEAIIFSIAMVIVLIGSRYILISGKPESKDEKFNNQSLSVKTIFKSDKLLRKTLKLNLLSQVSFAALNGLWVPFLVVLYNATPFQISITFIAQSIGGFVGSFLIIGRLGSNPELKRIRWLYIFLCVSTLLYTVQTSFILLTLILIVEGIILEWGRLPIRLVWQYIPPQDIRGAVFANLQSKISLIAIISTLFTGFLADLIGVKLVFIFVIIVFFLITSIVAWNLKGNPLKLTKESTLNA
jgi:MFS transporter, DHA3 family, macrolide efflux protein